MPEFTLEQAIQKGLDAEKAGRFAEAESIAHQILAQHPNYFAAHHLIGILAARAERFPEALKHLADALAANPTDAACHQNRATVLAHMGQLDEAIAAYQRSLELVPNNAHGWANLGNALRETGHLEEGLQANQKAVQIGPTVPWARYSLGLAFLQIGKYEQGWREHEWGLQVDHLGPPLAKLAQPRWDGSNLAGRRIFLQTQQGFGDAIFFARFASDLAKRGGRVIMECYAPLERLFRTVPGVEQTALKGSPPPDFDVHLPLTSVPLMLQTTRQTIPTDVPYVFPDEQAVALWRSRTAGGEGKLKIGLVWAGNKRPRDRSIPPAALAPLKNVPGLWFCSLQKDPTAHGRPDFPMEDWTNELNDFADTAALIANLDLVVTIDSAVAHLAGAMGKPVWLLLLYVPDWRWMTDRRDCIWYPTMRLFRQKRLGDWTAPVNQLISELHTWVKHGDSQ